MVNVEVAKNTLRKWCDITYDNSFHIVKDYMKLEHGDDIVSVYFSDTVVHFVVLFDSGDQVIITYPLDEYLEWIELNVVG